MMKLKSATFGFAVVGLFPPGFAQQPNSSATAVVSHFRLLRSTSGTTGRVVGNRYAIDDVRNRFYVPEDTSMVIYFEWDGPLGKHKLEGIWKRPDGMSAWISEASVDAKEAQFGAYWTYKLSEDMPPGIWELAVRIDGEPAGSHAFEVLLTAKPNVPSRKLPSPDDIYKAAVRSVVWIQKLDGRGQRINIGSGFVLKPGAVVTAFQAIDGASNLRVVLPDGRSIETSQLISWNRLQDWAIVKVDTGASAPLRCASPPPPAVGERVTFLNVEGENTRVIGSAHLVGRRSYPELGERLYFNSGLAPTSVGGPALNDYGEVIGVIGGSVLPGVGSIREGSTSVAIWASLHGNGAATPIALVSDSVPSKYTTLVELSKSGELTRPTVPTTNIIYAGTTNRLEKKESLDSANKDVSEFSKRDKEVIAFVVWHQNEKMKKGITTFGVYDIHNRERIKSQASKLRVPVNGLSRSVFSFAPPQLEEGTYRIDVLVNDEPVWRTYFRITN